MQLRKGTKKPQGKMKKEVGRLKKKVYNNFLIMVVVEFFLQ